MAPKRRTLEMPPPTVEAFSTASRESAILVKRSAGSKKENGDSKKSLIIEGNVGSRKEGKDPIFGKPRDQKVFELSEKICKGEEMVDINEKIPKSRTTVETSMYSTETTYCVGQLIKYSEKVGRYESVMMEGMELISVSKKSDWVARWKTLDIESLGILVKKVELLLEMKKAKFLSLKSKMIQK